MIEFQVGDDVRRALGTLFRTGKLVETIVEVRPEMSLAYIRTDDGGRWGYFFKELALVRRDVDAGVKQDIQEKKMSKFEGNITIGCDPEFFVKVGRTFKSAHGLVQGTKAEPFPLKDGAVQVDGLALEFNITPCSTAEQFDSCITSVLNQVRGMVPEKYTFHHVPTAKFTPAHMAKQPPEALELGCEPDYDAYQGLANQKPEGPLGLRTAAGHVHIGVDKPLSELDKRKLIILCDIFLGLDSLNWDTDTLRRSMYGKAGCFRSKPYGVEYRTMSNAWVTDPELRKRVFDGAVMAVNNLGNFKEIVECVEAKTYRKYYEVLPDVINNSRPKVASIILQAVKKLVA